ncbi:MAG: hypothetical protein ACRYFU_03840 [Janthinobacterium lividum]
MATKKVVAKKTAVPAKKTAVPAKKTAATKSIPAKAPAKAKAPIPKMTKTQVIREMAEQMDVSPKQIGAFFDLLIETATTQTRKGRRVHDSRSGQAREGSACSENGSQPGHRRIDQDSSQDHREVSTFQSYQGRRCAIQEIVRLNHRSAGESSGAFLAIRNTLIYNKTNNLSPIS